MSIIAKARSFVPSGQPRVSRCTLEGLEGRPMMAVLPAGFEETRTVSTLSSPVAQAFTPDGRLFILEQEGRLRVVLNGQLRPTPAITLNVD